jgi:NTE family protein
MSMHYVKTIKATLLTLAIATVLGAAVASCSSSPPREIAPIEGRQIDSAQSKQPSGTTRQRLVVGLALGGGGLRGLAHIGVLQALEEAGIRPSIVVGTSAGALVGAAYASGKTPREIQALAREVKIPSFVDFTFSSRGLMRGDHIAAWVDTITGEVPIEAFPIKFAAVATDLQRGVPVLLERGAPGNAVRASASVPGVQVPVAYRDGYLIDGGIASLVPVRAARALGADIVIAVDIYCPANQTAGLSAAAVLRHTMYTQSCLVAAPELAEADIRILPVVAVPGISNKDQQQQTIKVGYEAARKALASTELTRTLANERWTLSDTRFAGAPPYFAE